MSLDSKKIISEEVKRMKTLMGILSEDIFDFLKDGPIKADFWRICALYKYGGIYSDIDIEPLIPLSKFIEPNVSFVTCSAYRRGLLFNPSFIIAPKESIILKNAINWYIKKYLLILYTIFLL